MENENAHAFLVCPEFTPRADGNVYYHKCECADWDKQPHVFLVTYEFGQVIITGPIFSQECASEWITAGLYLGPLPKSDAEILRSLIPGLGLPTEKTAYDGVVLKMLWKSLTNWAKLQKC